MSGQPKNFIQRARQNMTANLAIHTAANAICDWLTREGITPEQLEAWAQSNTPVITQLLSTVVAKDAAWARGVFAGVARSLTEAHVWEIVRTDRFARMPAHRDVIVRHYGWFRSQMLDAQKWLAGGN